MVSASYLDIVHDAVSFPVSPEKDHYSHRNYNGSVDSAEYGGVDPLTDKSLSIIISSIHPPKQHLLIPPFYFCIVPSGYRNQLPCNKQISNDFYREAYDLYAVQYLLKPVQEAEVKKLLAKVAKSIAVNRAFIQSSQIVILISILPQFCL